jgi:hypothetical protein
MNTAMSIKKKILIFISIIILITLYGAIKEKNKKQNKDKAATEWFNGWIQEAIEMREMYHLKLSKLPIKEIISENEYFDVESMQELKKSQEGSLAVEIWKIDRSIEISNKWYDNITPMLSNYHSVEKIEYLKNYLKIGITEGQSFKHITSEYFNDHLEFVEFLLDRDCDLSPKDEDLYNNLARKVEASSIKYTNAVANIYNNNIRRTKEFNIQFENENLDILLDIITEGE